MNYSEGLADLQSRAAGGAGEGVRTPPENIASILAHTQFIETASILSTLMEMAEMAGREGPDLLHGGMVSYFEDEGAGRYTYSTASRPLSLEFLGDGLWAGTQEEACQAFDARLVLIIQLWPLPWLESCYLAAAQHIRGERSLILIGPQNQHAFLALESESAVMAKLVASRLDSQNFASCSVMDSLESLGGIEVMDPNDWDLKLLSESASTHALRLAGNDLFADIWSNARYMILWQQSQRISTADSKT